MPHQSTAASRMTDVELDKLESEVRRFYAISGDLACKLIDEIKQLKLEIKKMRESCSCNETQM